MKKSQPSTKETEVASASEVEPVTEVAPEHQKSVADAKLRKIAESCESALSAKDRGKVKLLVYRDEPSVVAALQIGDLKISLYNNDHSQSMHRELSFMDALKLAAKGYRGIGMYIPVPQELEEILSQRDVINVYLAALGLEQISRRDDFWCVDVIADWNTGWKRFNWNAKEAFSCLCKKARIRLSWGLFFYSVKYRKEPALFLLIRAYDHLFAEV